MIVPQLTKRLPRFRKARRQLATFALREAWSRDEIELFQLARLNKIWRHASRYVPYYREVKSEHNVPAQFANLAEFSERMPLLTKESIRQRPNEFLSLRAKRGTWQRTSGSTGVPVRVFRPQAPHLEMLRAKYRFYQMWGIDIFDRMVWLWSDEDTIFKGFAAISNLRQRILDKARNRLRLSVSNLCRRLLRQHLTQISRFRPLSLYGYSCATHLLAQEALATGFRCASLKLVVLSGEAATSRMVSDIERAFCVPVVMEYGCVELGSIAFGWPDRTFRVREDVVLLETLKQGDQRYHVVLTALNNPSFPLIRYEIGDIADAPLLLPPRGFAILPPICGRHDDMLLSGTGRVLNPTCVDELFEFNFFEAVRRYRVHQQADGSMLVSLEKGDQRTTPNLDEIRRHIENLVEGYPVTVRVVDTIARAGSGKHRVITSELTPPTIWQK